MKIRKLLCSMLTGLILVGSSSAHAESPQAVIRQIREETRKIQSNNRKIARLVAKLNGANYLLALQVLKGLGDSDVDGLPDLLDKKRCVVNPIPTPSAPDTPNTPEKPVARDLSGSYAGTFRLIEDNCGISDYFFSDGYYSLGISTNLNNNSAAVSGFTSACEETFNGSINGDVITANYTSDIVCPLGTTAEVKHSLVFNGFSASGFSSGTMTRKVSCPGFGTCQLKYSGKAVKLSAVNLCR